MNETKRKVKPEKKGKGTGQAGRACSKHEKRRRTQKAPSQPPNKERTALSKTENTRQ